MVFGRLYCAANRLLPAALLICLGCSGCDRPPAPQFRFNRVEWVKQERLALSDGEHFRPEYEREIITLLTALFGSPDEPRVPNLFGTDDPLNSIIDLENLKKAAGPVQSNEVGAGSGLYREHCAHCHGVSGDGKGPTATALYPYPRDFRLGKFKFKGTPLRRPPTDADLVRIIRNGIPGSAMPAFKTLPDDEVRSLVDYVKYLSIRGEFERRLLAELSSLDGKSLIELEKFKASRDDAGLLQLDEQSQEMVEGLFYEDVVERWTDRDDSLSEVPPPPSTMVNQSPAPAAMVSAGRSLFFGKANCVQCHGATGLGDGQTQNYDDWANDWLKTPNVDPLIKTSYQNFIDAGALPPLKIRPRNLRLPVYRGGNSPADLYRRVANGIEGTPMPSSPSLTPEEIWALVAYVQALPFGGESGSGSANKSGQ